MFRFASLLVIAVLFGAVGIVRGQGPQNQRAREAAALPEGEGKQIVSTVCIACHGVESTGGTIGPRLDGVKPIASPIFLAAAMWNHGPQMAEVMRARGVPRPTFKDTELNDLIAYINSASTAPRGGPLVVLPGRADDGRRLFADKRCVDCHSIRGQGGKVGPDLAERGAHDIVGLDAGIQFFLTPRVALDAAAETSFGGPGPDYAFRAGVSVRLGR